MDRIFFAFPDERQKGVIFLGSNNQGKSIRPSHTILIGESSDFMLFPPV